MQTIWKYEVPIEDYFEIMMPKGAKILTVQTQLSELDHGGLVENVCIWCIFDENVSGYEKRKFRLAGTGHDIKEDPLLMTYIGTFQTNSGAFIGHLFELKE